MSAVFGFIISISMPLTPPSDLHRAWYTPLSPDCSADEKPDVSYADIGGMDIQKQEMREAVELPLTHHELYKQIGEYSVHAMRVVRLFHEENLTWWLLLRFGTIFGDPPRGHVKSAVGLRADSHHSYGAPAHSRLLLVLIRPQVSILLAAC